MKLILSLGALVATFLVLGQFLTSCTGPGKQDSIGDQIIILRERTLPQGSSVISSTGIEAHAESLRSSWELQTERPWPEYRAWIEQQLRHGHCEQRADNNSMMFTKQLPGDSLTLQIQIASAGPPLRVRPTLVARPE